MSLPPVIVRPGVSSVVPQGGVPVVALYGGSLGGYITNPRLATDQGIASAEVLFVDPTGPAAAVETNTTIPIQPGQSYTIPADQATPLWVNAQTSGHRFSSIFFLSSVAPPTPTPGSFPPTGPTTLTQLIPSYLYEEYFDDDDMQAFVASFNSIAQNYVDTFNALNLPVYTGSIIQGALLDWVAQGLYGMSRPALSSGKTLKRGPFNTYMFNTTEMNKFSVIEPDDIIVTSDDIFKRILTWHLYKGDGKVFNIRWLKRRIMRFLIGENGTAPNIDQTYQISVTFGPSAGVSIRLLSEIRSITQAAMFNSFLLNSRVFNEVETKSTLLTPLPNAAIFQEAVESGVLELPFQFVYTVTI